MKDLLNFEESAFYGAKLSGVQSVSYYLENQKIENIENIELDSQSSALSSSIGTCLSGKRTFVPIENINSIKEMITISSMRLPIVAYNLSKFDNDVFIIRDTGWIIFLVESCQELLDTIIQSYKISEKVMLPSIINVDGLFNMRETVNLPNDKSIKKFLPELKTNFNLKKNNAFNPFVEDNSEFRIDQQKSMENTLKLSEEINEIWYKKFRRKYSSIETYKTEDADYVIIGYGFNSSVIKKSVDEMRKEGEKVGFLRIRLLRPFPEEKIRETLHKIKKVAVIDNHISLGYHGILFSQIRHLHKNCNSFISLKPLKESDVKKVIREIESDSVTFI